MKKKAVSLRQVIVLTVTGLVAPAVDLLPGALARRAGGGAWLTPVLMLPVLVLWVVVLGRVFRAEESGLFPVLRQSLGRGLGWAFTLLYIMWAVWLLTEQVGRSAARMSAAYGGRGGEWMAAFVLVLAVWMVWKEEDGLYRAAELFWLVAAVAVAVFLGMTLPQINGTYLLPQKGEWGGQVESGLYYINVWATAVFSSALLTKVPRKTKAVRQAVGWTIASCLIAAGILAGILGQMGAGLAKKLEQPFLITVQGLSLEGAIGRLEAPAAALWLEADFCRMGLFLLALREAGGERGGKWLVVAGGVLAFVSQRIFLTGVRGGSAGLLLGVLVPVCLWIVSLCKEWRKSRPTSCGK